MTPLIDAESRHDSTDLDPGAASRLLHEISNELIGEQDADVLYRKIVEAGHRLMRSDYASMQAIGPDAAGNPGLDLIAHRGFTPAAAAHWMRVGIFQGTVCGAALGIGERIIIEDVENTNVPIGKLDADMFRALGIRGIQSTPLCTRKGQVIGMLSTHWSRPHTPSEHDLWLLDVLARQAADALERAKEEAARRRIEERLRFANQQKDQFLATLAHELRNPLAPVRNGLTLLQQAQDEGVRHQLLGMLDRQVGHLVRLVDDLLDVSRISQGTIGLQIGMVNLNEALQSAIDASTPLMERKRQTLERSTHSPQGTALLVRGDPVRLTQVFTNLLNNAAKYSGESGRIALDVREIGDEVEIAVRDSGAGIAAEDMPRLFQLFSRVGVAGSEDGLGIGLYLAQQIVGLHGGTVRAESGGTGQGSCFTVRLPLAERATVTDLATLAAASAPIARPAPVTPGATPVRVLLVDDNRDAADALAMLLSTSGAEVQVVYDGPAALAAFAANRPQIVLLDIGMPGMNGYEVAARMRADPGNGALCLVALTGWGDSQAREKAAGAGFDHHLTKPIDHSLLVSLIHEARMQSRPCGDMALS